MEILECGKIMKLHGLSASQWNGNAVSIMEQLEENGQRRYLCEVILGENKGKKLKVKEVNLMEIPPPSADQLELANEKCSEILIEFGSVYMAHPINVAQINKLRVEINELIEVVPNCCVLWQQLAAYGTFL